MQRRRASHGRLCEADAGGIRIDAELPGALPCLALRGKLTLSLDHARKQWSYAFRIPVSDPSRHRDSARADPARDDVAIVAGSRSTE
ncbi:MAG: hypothetical protein DPW13_15155 [Planctomycetes bacterium]|nr:hypothetical protein [Planctomycetota bacterium]